MSEKDLSQSLGGALSQDYSMQGSCYLMNSSSQYFGSGQSESSTISSSLSI